MPSAFYAFSIFCQIITILPRFWLQRGIILLFQLEAGVVRLPFAGQLQLQQSYPVEHGASGKVYSLMLRRRKQRCPCAKNTTMLQLNENLPRLSVSTAFHAGRIPLSVVVLHFEFPSRNWGAHEDDMWNNQPLTSYAGPSGITHLPECFLSLMLNMLHQCTIYILLQIRTGALVRVNSSTRNMA